MEHLARIPGLVGVAPSSCRVVILEIQNSDPLGGYPPNVNYAAAFSYKVNVQTTDGMDGPFVGAIPSVPRPPYPWLVTAFPVGAILPAGVMDGVIYIDAAEERWAAPCGWVPGQEITQPPRPPKTIFTDSHAIPTIGGGA